MEIKLSNSFPSRCLDNQDCFHAHVGFLSDGRKGLLWLPHSTIYIVCLPFCSFVFLLQWMTTRGLRWSACTPRWWSASRAPRLRWAPLWKRPWDPSKTSCSLPSLESRTERPEQVHSQPFLLVFFFFLNSTYNEEILNVSIQLMCFKRARTWTLFEPHPRWHEATCRLPTSDPHRGLHSCIIVCFSCELNTTTPKFSRRLDCIQC